MEWWSWTLTAVGITGLYLVGRKKTVGWVVGIGAQALWIAFAIATRQYGFIVSAVAYAGVNVYNLRRWKKEEK